MNALPRRPILSPAARHFFSALMSLFVALLLPVQDADAKRFGGGKSTGIQREPITRREAPPAQREQPRQDQAQNAAGAQAAGASGKRNGWLGPVAGLAAGLGLAALASHLGLGEEFANLLLIALLAMGGLLLFRLFTRGRAQVPAGMQYAGAAAGPAGPAYPMGAPLPGGAGQAPSAAGPALPADFDAQGFTRQAKLNFLRLQAANDAGNLEDIREFTSPEMYAEIRLQLEERGRAAQRTEVLELDAEILACVEEAHRQRVSVRFSGLIREGEGAPAEAFDEVWHLTRPVRGGQGWVVAGIQQAA